MPQKTRVIRRRISSVSNTKKITRTMEMVAASKLKRAQARVMASGPYNETLRDIMVRLSASGLDPSDYPLFEEREVKRVLLWILTADRGLCGAFNVNLIRYGREVLEAEKAKGHDITLWMSGRKGVSNFKFRGIPMDRTITGMPDKPTFEDARRFAKELTEPFLAGEVDKVLIVWPKFLSLGRQPPSVLQLAPIPRPEPEDGAEESKGGVEFLFEPGPKEIFGKLLPLYIENMVFRVLAEMVAAEMIARRMAMKLATDNAEKLVKQLTLQYNKARQAQITQEIAEILGGSEALE